MTDCDVLIIGAGPVGIVSGLLLVIEGLRVTLIEKESQIIQSPRALVYHPQIQSSLEKAGILEEMKKQGKLAEEGVVWRDVNHAPLGTMSPLSLEPEDKPQDPRFRIPVLLGQHKVAEIACKSFQGKGGKILFDHAFESLDQQGNKVHVNTIDSKGIKQSFTASFVIGADGGRSPVRKAVGARLEGYTHPMNMMAVNLRYPRIYETGFGDAQFIVDPQAKVEDSAFAVIIHTGTDDIWRCAYVDGEHFSDAELKARLAMKLKMTLPGHPDEGEYEVTHAQPYRIHQRCASTFAQGRVLLVGDAAHLNNPVGGFGLNTGLLDTPVAAAAIVDAMKMSDEAAVDKRLKEFSDLRRAAFLDATNPVTTQNLRRSLEISDEAEEKLRKDFFAKLQVKAGQREVALGANKMALGIPGF